MDFQLELDYRFTGSHWNQSANTHTHQIHCAVYNQYVLKALQFAVIKPYATSCITAEQQPLTSMHIWLHHQ